MNKFLAPITAIILGVCLVLSTGCKTTTTPGSGGTTNAVSRIDVDKAAIALKTATWGALTVVIQKNPTNAPPYIKLASVTLTEFIGGTNYTPGALTAAINKLPQGALKKPEVQYAVLSVTMAYELAYATYVQDAVGGNADALKLITAVRDGCDAALKGALVSP
jgi:hypothetical protein